MTSLNPFPPAEDLSGKVFVALGAATTCWENMEGTGVFDSTRAKQIGDDLIAFIEANYERISPVKVEDYDQLALFGIDSH